jgi:hypothetical protein
MIYLKSTLSGLSAVALCALIAFVIFIWTPLTIEFDSHDILLFGVLPVLMVFAVAFWWMFKRESKRFSR